MKTLKPHLRALCIVGAFFLLVSGVTAQDVQPFRLVYMGWDDLNGSTQALVSLPAEAQPASAVSSAPMRVILTKADAVPNLPAADREQMRTLAREGVPIICQGADRELARLLGIHVVDVTDDSLRGGELMALCYQNGLWPRAYFIPLQGKAESTPETGGDRGELLNKALAWVAKTATPASQTYEAGVRPQGPPQPQDAGDTTGAGWNGMERIQWYFTAYNGTSKIVDYWVSVTPFKLRDNRADQDWYLIETSTEHAPVYDYRADQHRCGWWVGSHQMDLSRADALPTLEEHGPGTTEGQQSVSLSIGAELGASLEGPASGLNTSFTRTYNIQDVTINNRSDRSRNVARWDDYYRSVSYTDYPFCNWDDYPPQAAITAHVTKQASIWKLPAYGVGSGVLNLWFQHFLGCYNDTDDPWLFGCGYHRQEVAPYQSRYFQIFKNYAPETPKKPSMPSPVQVGLSADAETSGVDPDGNPVRFKYDWGDGQGEYGAAVQAHFYTQAGTYNVRTRAIDTYGDESLWSESFAVTVIGQPPPAPMITGCSVPTNGLFQVKGAGTAGMTYTLQSSTDLVNWNYASITVLAGPDGSIDYSGPMSVFGPACYFRLCWP
jgi:hypothetical protein